ncbi:MAG: rod shape-determining protein, partial [Ruminococcaceae bacterium]|nr:rod shape-determining protein [Oscillospiraceae bacterium]
GGALLAGLDILITQVTGIRAMVAKNPLDSVAVGIGHVIENENGGVSYRNRYKGL